ncbi:hypothetical protein [Chryseobacterium daeguense]|uniref:hypothetical protein n=1 Tax=Chryseobacterium daeguense TaxID=412438 RepID=UPI0004206489|nr:hypothetical protein [Chryseobacterium daeguense]
MKKLLYSFLLLSSATLFAQKNPATKFAVANDIVGTVDMFTMHKDAVKGSQVYKTAASLPQNLKKYSSIAENGLVEYKFKTGQDNIDRLPLSDLNIQYMIPEETPVYIDGYEFTNTKTLVFGDILTKMEAKDKDGKKTLFITTK